MVQREGCFCSCHIEGILPTFDDEWTGGESGGDASGVATVLVLALLAVDLPGCVSSNTTAVRAANPAPAALPSICAAPLEPFVKVTLYMGRGTRNASEWQSFVDTVLVRHFPDGGTMLETSGWWEGRVGDAADKNSRMLVMLYPAAARDAFAAGVQAVIADIKDRFGEREAVRSQGLPVLGRRATAPCY